MGSSRSWRRTATRTSAETTSTAPIVLWLLATSAARTGSTRARSRVRCRSCGSRPRRPKIRLSADERTALTIPFDGFTYHREITRAELEAAHREARGFDAHAVPDGARRRRAGALGRRRRWSWWAGRRAFRSCAAGCQELFGKTPHSQLTPTRSSRWGPRSKAHILAGGITTCSMLDVTLCPSESRRFGGNRERADCAEHDHPHERARDVHDVGGRPARRRHARRPGRTRAREDCRSLAASSCPDRSDAGGNAEESRWCS